MARKSINSSESESQVSAVSSTFWLMEFRGKLQPALECRMEFVFCIINLHGIALSSASTTGTLEEGE
ncbi:hypothetical protein A6R68_04757, partial [Neotoma lepida]